jgi:hypothetical protein
MNGTKITLTAQWWPLTITKYPILAPKSRANHKLPWIRNNTLHIQNKQETWLNITYTVPVNITKFYNEVWLETKPNRIFKGRTVPLKWQTKLKFIWWKNTNSLVIYSSFTLVFLWSSINVYGWIVSVLVFEIDTLLYTSSINQSKLWHLPLRYPQRTAQPISNSTVFPGLNVLTVFSIILSRVSQSTRFSAVFALFLQSLPYHQYTCLVSLVRPITQHNFFIHIQ